MNLNRIKRLLKKYLPFIIIILATIIIFSLFLIFPYKITRIICLSIFTISVVLRLIIEILSKSNQIKIPIKDKKKTLTKLYNIFDLENTNNIVAINTKEEKVLTRAKKLFPGSREQKQKDLYSIMLPTVTLEKLELFLKDNNPDRIIIHQFSMEDEKQKNIKRKITICIDTELIIQYSKNSLSKEEINQIKEELTEE